MQGYLPRRLLVAMLALCLATAASAGEILSTMRNVNAVVEAHGFRLNMVHDTQIPPMASDLSPAQAFEVLRPAGKEVTIGRLFTSCSCIQLESPKRNYGPNERVILTLRNIKPTPPAGQVYAIFVQITSPVRTTLRFDTYVQSGMAGGMPFDNPAGTRDTTAQAPAQPQATQQAASIGGYSGSGNADAVAALTRQIDQGFAQASARPAPLEAPADLSLATPAMAPPAPATATSNVAEARETPAAPLPTTAVQTPAARTAEAREVPAALPPVQPIQAATQTAAAVREIEPPAGVALVPGAVAQTQAAAPALPPLQLPAQTAVRQEQAVLPPLTTAAVVSREIDENNLPELDEGEADDFNPLLGNAPAPGTAVVAPLQPAPPAAAQVRTTQATTAAPAGGAFTANTLSVEELERELKNDVDELYARETVSGGISDQEILEKERTRLENDEDLGTADLLTDLRNLGETPPPAAARTTTALPPLTTATTAATTAVQAPVVQPLTAPAAAAAPADNTAYVPAALAQQQTSGFLVDEIVPTAVGQVGDNLPPPPGLSAPAGEPGLLTAREVPAQNVQNVYEGQVAPLTAPVAAQVTSAPAPAYNQNYAQAYDRDYEEGVPEPRPERNPNVAKPVQAVSLITVGVRDLAASIRFYEALGWRRAARGKYDQTAFFQLQGQILALYPMNELLAEQNMPGAAPTPGGITLALHVQDRADVWSIYQRFVDAGGKSLRPPAEMASGAVTSYVADPDGNAWEISWVPQFRIDEEGGLWLP